MSERPTPDLQIVETRVYRGPNVWSYDRAIHLVVDLGGLEQFPTDKLPGFADHLLEALPGVAQHSCSRGRRGGFVERLHEGTWLGHVTEHCALAYFDRATDMAAFADDGTLDDRPGTDAGAAANYRVLYARALFDVAVTADDGVDNLNPRLKGAAGIGDGRSYDFGALIKFLASLGSRRFQNLYAAADHIKICLQITGGCSDVPPVASPGICKEGLSAFE